MIPKTLAQRVQEDQRLVILRVLNDAPGCTANEAILHAFLGDIGHECSREKVRTELAWLCEQGLVTYEELVTVMVARITERGIDVATGRARVPGIARPTPR